MTKLGVKQKHIAIPRCFTCQFGLKNPGFNYDILHSSYFEPDSPVSVKDVLAKYHFKQTSGMKGVIRHLKAHVEPKRLQQVETRVKQAVTAAERGELTPGRKWAYHEDALDRTIDEYYKLLDQGKIKVTADIGLKAIKIKSDIEKARQDRTLGAFKAFTGMSHEDGTIPKQIGKPAD